MILYGDSERSLWAYFMRNNPVHGIGVYSRWITEHNGRYFSNFGNRSNVVIFEDDADYIIFKLKYDIH